MYEYRLIGGGSGCDILSLFICSYGIMGNRSEWYSLFRVGREFLNLNCSMYI